AFVGIESRASERGERRSVREQPRGEVKGEVGKTDVVSSREIAGPVMRGIEHVNPAALVGQRHIEMGAGAKVIAEWLRHKSGDRTERTGDVLGHKPATDHPSAH